MKGLKFPCSGILVNSGDRPIRLLKEPDLEGMGVGLVPNRTLCIVMDLITVEETEWYWVDLYGTYAYVRKENLKIRR